jgi:hypothetical protein
VSRCDSPWGLDENGDGFHLLATATSDIAYDPVDGTTEKLLGGWNRADHVTRPLVSGTRRAIERADDGRPLRVRIDGEDDLGRELVADGDCVNWLRWQGYPHTFQWWCMVRWRIRGREAWGEVRELTPLALSRRYYRGRRR